MRLKTLIVDDEPLALSRLKRLLAGHSQVDIVAEARNGQQAVDLVAKLAPDLVIMDIRMPVLSGLQAASIMAEHDQPPAIVFCTAYNQYAIAAFETSAVGYVVKPVELDKINQAIENASALNKVQLSQISASQTSQPTIMVKGLGSLENIPSSSIEYFQAEDKKVLAYLADRVVMVDYALTELETLLGDQFIRVHRSTLVNTMAVSKVVRQESGQSVLVTLSDVEILISRRLIGAVKRAIKR